MRYTEMEDGKRWTLGIRKCEYNYIASIHDGITVPLHPQNIHRRSSSFIRFSR